MPNFALQSRDKRSLVAVQSFCAIRSLAYALKHPRLWIAQASLALLSARRSLTDWNIIDNNCFGVLVG